MTLWSLRRSHVANTLSMYRTVKRLGIPDSNIILMLADDVACNSRSKFPATVYNNNRRLLDLYGNNIEVDYRGYEVTVENFIRMLTGRVDEHVPRSKRLLTDDRSNILVFLTGHGGEDFLKFQDAEELGSQDLADAFAQMHEKKRYNEIFFLIDTCQAESMYKRIYSPNILSAASSLTGESSYSHHVDFELGVSVIDRFTYYNLETLERVHREDPNNLADLFATYDYSLMHSHVGIRNDLFSRPLEKAGVLRAHCS
nr:glycosylphosphatidylinositol anchor biosynthesis [Polyrhizophydium stewartii]